MILTTRVVRNWCLGVLGYAANFTNLLPIPFFAIVWPIKCNMTKDPIYNGQIKNLRPLLNINRGIVTIDKRSQNLILTTRIVRNFCLGVVGSENA